MIASSICDESLFGELIITVGLKKGPGLSGLMQNTCYFKVRIKLGKNCFILNRKIISFDVE